MMEEARITLATLEDIAGTFPPKPLPTVALHMKNCVLQAAGAIMRAQELDTDERDLRRAAIISYITALPTMTDKDSIHAYIACVAQGLAMGFIGGKKASKLLYAAQVALSVLKEPKVNVKVKQKTVTRMEASRP